FRLRHANCQPRAAVAHERLDLRTAVGHVQRTHQRAQARDGEVADDEFRNVRQLHRDHVAARHAECHEPVRGSTDTLVELAPRQGSVLKYYGGRIRALGDMAREPFRERVVGPPAARNVFAFHPTYINRMDEALLLSRVQFGLNIGFHILFPAITIGLAWLMVYFRVRYEQTRDPAWLQSYRLWVGGLDPRAQFLDAHAGGTRARRRGDHRGELARGDLQPVVPLPAHAHAARLGHHRVVPGRRLVGLAPAARGGRRSRGQDAA